MSRGLELRAALAAELAGDGGQAITITRSNKPGTYNPATGVSTAGATVTDNGRGRVGSYSDFQVNGESILQTDRRITYQPGTASFVPAIGDKITVGGSILRVIDVKEYETGGVWISYRLQAR